jgi:hypothetical protein
MNTIQFTGAEHKIENLHLALGISDNDMPQQSETRVYVVREKGEQYLHSKTDSEFMDLAEEQGTVFTLEGFQQAFNFNGGVDTDIDIIRFISVPLYL